MPARCGPGSQKGWRTENKEDRALLDPETSPRESRTPRPSSPGLIHRKVNEQRCCFTEVCSWSDACLSGTAAAAAACPVLNGSGPLVYRLRTKVRASVYHGAKKRARSSHMISYWRFVLSTEGITSGRVCTFFQEPVWEVCKKCAAQQKHPRCCFFNSSCNAGVFLLSPTSLMGQDLCVPDAGCVPNMSVFRYVGFRQISCWEGTRI